MQTENSNEGTQLELLNKELSKVLVDFDNAMNALFGYEQDLEAIKANGDCEKMQNIITLASEHFDNENTDFINKIIHV